MKRLVLLIFVLLLATAQYAEAIFFRHFLPEDGLVHPAVISICQDSLGRLWLGTENGISIYNGSSFSSIKPEGNGNGEVFFDGTVIYDILCIENGDVFFRTDEELVRYNSRTEEITTVYDKPVSALFVEDKTLFAIDDNKLMSWKPSLGKIDYIRTLPFRNITHFLKDRFGRTWLAAQDGLYHSESRKGYTKVCPNNDIYSLFESSDRSIWVSSREEGLMTIAPDGLMTRYNTANSHLKGFNSNDVRQITEDTNGNIWFGTFNGLYCYNKSSGEFTSYLRGEREGSLSHSSVYAVFMDNAGILWVGTYYGGVNYADIGLNSMLFYPGAENNDGLSHPVAGHMVEDKEGKIWICTEGGGLNRLDPQTGKIDHFRTSAFPYYLPNTNLKWIDYDSDNDLLYIGTTFKGLYSYDIRKNRFEHLIDEQNTEKALANINAFVRYGNRFFLSTRSGIFVHTLTDKTDSLLCSSRTLNFYPVTKRNENELWAVCDDIRVYDMSSLKMTKAYSLTCNGKTARPLNIFTSPSGGIYATTYGNGIFKFNDKEDRFDAFVDNSSALLNMYCYRIAWSKDSNMIVSGEKGINIISSEGNILETYLLGNNIPLTAIVRDCGLIVSASGTIYAGGTNGLMAFIERDHKTIKADKGIYFSELFINGKQVSPYDGTSALEESLPYTNTIRLRHNQGRIGIRFASRYNLADFNIADYEYHLSGYDNKWYPMGSDRITYTNLSPGKYTLEVRNRYAPSGNNEYKHLDIRVLTPWYASLPAILLYIAIFLSVIYFLMREARAKAAAAEEIRRERMEKENLVELNEAKLRFFTSISHEFKTPLTIMSGQIGTILQTYKLAPSVYNRMLKVMHQTKHLGHLVSDLIEFRKYEQDKVILHVSRHDINDFAADIFSRFDEVAKQNNIDFSLILSPEDTSVLVDPERMERILMNLLSNAFKFTPKGGSISLEVSADEKNVLLHVKDTGQGISDEEKAHIFERFYRAGDGHIQGSGIGLSLAKELVELHHGTINVNSIVDKGSDFVITLKKGDSHFTGDEKVVIENNAAVEDVKDSIVLNYNAESSEEAAVIPETSDGQKETILIVEDNPELLEILEELFAPLYNTLKADNGKDALEIVKNERPALVVSDILMPIMTGVELCSAIKSDIDLCHIPVVLLTALDMPEQQLSGLLQGADDYIGKPFDSRLLLARCNNIICNRKNLLKQIGLDNKVDISMLATNRLDKEFLDKLSDIIDNNISNVNLNNDLIAERMNMSRASFYNKFKSLTGETPNEYLNNIRLSKATSLLIIEQGMSIADIAYALGFNSANYFSRKFKDKFGMSPVQYRQEKTE